MGIKLDLYTLQLVLEIVGVCERGKERERDTVIVLTNITCADFYGLDMTRTDNTSDGPPSLLFNYCHK